jgi:hypothetical protein
MIARCIEVSEKLPQIVKPFSDLKKWGIKWCASQN